MSPCRMNRAPWTISRYVAYLNLSHCEGLHVEFNQSVKIQTMAFQSWIFVIHECEHPEIMIITFSNDYHYLQLFSLCLLSSRIWIHIGISKTTPEQSIYWLSLPQSGITGGSHCTLRGSGVVRLKHAPILIMHQLESITKLLDRHLLICQKCVS